MRARYNSCKQKLISYILCVKNGRPTVPYTVKDEIPNPVVLTQQGVLQRTCTCQPTEFECFDKNYMLQ